ncbi:zinc finger CCCH-type antiviral protein 1-like isoform X2 [Candoia aspera]|uniref:zinc finger CCCH-type antiviral protein 1-like isoform X2 n=1 Tax=Candoia aspera TaxID=51853 RepID=UPI002FD7E0A5
MADPAVCSYVAKVLCSRGGRARLDELPQEVGLSPTQLRQVLEDAGPARFLVRRQGGVAWVLAASAVRLCVRQACGDCERLHLCKLNLRGRCRFSNCKYSHDILSEGNRKVLKNHDLSGLNEEELCVLLLQNDPFLLPDVCGAYNKGEGSCPQQDNCTQLHICRYFLKGECRFPHCKRSHNLLDPNSVRLLLPEGLDSNVIWNIQMICDARTAALREDLTSYRRSSTNPTPGASGERSNAARPKDDRHRPTPNAKDFVNLGHPDQGVKTAPPPKPLNAEKKKSDEICLYYVWQFCKNKNNCSNIHYDLPYRWQIFTDNGWKDLPRREEIEKAYCDPRITSFPDLDLNFRTMTSAAAPIRRLSTVSSVTRNAKFVMTTKWLWYWKNDLGQWIEYGKQDRRLQHANLTSDDLENVFLADPNGNISFEAGSQKYLLSFKDMTQKNLSYPTWQEVRRRPKFVSSEDVKTKQGHTATAAPVSTPVATSTYPPNWDNSALPLIGYAAIELTTASPEFMKIENLFQKTMKNFKIHRIERIQNPSLWQVYQWQMEQMKKQRGGQNADERLLFHGSNPSSMKVICMDNFDWRSCGTNGTILGKGSYFARDASYSDRYCPPKSGKKTMFVAQVLVGEFTVGHATYNRPPAKSAGMVNFYDSCVDDLLNPSIFVIFEKHQVYPAYIVSYSEEKTCVLS